MSTTTPDLFRLAQFRETLERVGLSTADVARGKGLHLDVAFDDDGKDGRLVLVASVYCRNAEGHFYFDPNTENEPATETRRFYLDGEFPRLIPAT